MILVDIGGGGAAIKGWVYTRPCRAEIKTFYFVYTAPLFQYLIYRNIHECGLFTEI